MYLPGLVFVCGAYCLTNAYARGAWTEMAAVSGLPPALTAAWYLLMCRSVTARAVPTSWCRSS